METWQQRLRATQLMSKPSVRPGPTDEISAYPGYTSWLPADVFERSYLMVLNAQYFSPFGWSRLSKHSIPIEGVTGC
jgi:hypothetical protein